MKLADITLIEKSDESVLDDSIIKEIKKSIRDGAKDLDKEWANVMVLVKSAYEHAGIVLPTPADRGGWNQYEELLNYAVSEMTEARKHLSQDWKMSSDVFGY